MTYRTLSLALLLAGCATGGTGRVEVSMGGESTTTAHMATGADADALFVGELYLNVVEVKARFEASDDPYDPACAYGDEGFDDDEVADEEVEHEEIEDDDIVHDEDGGEWVVLSEAAVAVSLTDALSSHQDPIGIAELPPGAVTELRFVLDEEEQATWVLPTGEHIPVTVPSGASSGLKLKGCMPIQAGYATVIDITADLDDALKETGNGEIKLHPSLRVVADLVADAE